MRLWFIISIKMYFLVVGAVLILIGYFSYNFFFKAPLVIPEPFAEVTLPPRKSSLKQKGKAKKVSKTPSHSKSTHKELINSFKNIQSGVIDFDIKPGYLAVCCEDSTLRIYKLHSLTDTKAKYVLGSLSKNQPSAITINPTGNLLYVAGSQDLQVHMFRVHNLYSKVTLEAEKTFVKKHTMKISSLAYTPSCIISCGEEEDTMIYFWSQTGELLGSHENKQLRHKKLSISQDYQFFTIAAWLGSARVFEIVKEKKTENFNSVHVIMELGGHSQGLTSVAFSPDSFFAVTCSQDLSVKLWNINVQYKFKEKPVLLKTLTLASDIPPPSCCGLNSNRLVLGCDANLRIYSVPDLEIVNVITDAHTQSLKKIEVVEDLVVSAANDPQIHLWHLD